MIFISMDELHDEVIQHWNKAKERCKQFQGRENILAVIKNYIMDKTNQPLVIHGASGKGLFQFLTQNLESICVCENLFCAININVVIL